MKKYKKNIKNMSRKNYFQTNLPIITEQEELPSNQLTNFYWQQCLDFEEEFNEWVRNYKIEYLQ